MARILKAPIHFLELRLVITSTVYNPVGSVNDGFLEKPVSADWINLRTMITRGSALFEFPGKDIPAITVSAPGPIAPTAPGLAGITEMRVTTLEDDVEVHCVIPFPGYNINHIEQDMIAGSQLQINRGCVIFVFGDNYTIEDDTYNSFQVFAIRNNNITINAITPCRVIVFKTTPK